MVKYICISNSGYKDRFHIGKQYEITSKIGSYIIDGYSYLKYSMDLSEYFIEISEYRKQKINKLLNESI